MYRLIAMCIILGTGKMFIDHYNNGQRHIKQTDELLKIVKDTNKAVKNIERRSN